MLFTTRGSQCSRTYLGDMRSASEPVWSRIMEPSVRMPSWEAMAMDIMGCPGGMKGSMLARWCG